MTEPTKGDWGVSAYDTTVVIAVRDGPDRHGHEYHDGRHQVVVARSAAAEDIPDIYERSANAHLMAAAKDLRDAGRDAFALLLRLRERELVADMPEIRQLGAALAKSVSADHGGA